MTPILIVVPCFNEVSHIEGLINYLLSELRTSEDLIVVADGGSSDGTIEILERLSNQNVSVKLVHNPKKLQSCGINQVVFNHAAGFDYFIRIDVHADYPEGYIDALIKEAIVTEAGSVVVSMDTQGKSCFQRAVALAQNSILGNGGSSHRNRLKEGRWVDHGHHALMRVDVFKAVQGYDISFSHNEDAELDYRISEKGYSIWLTAKTTLIYYPRDNAISLFKQYMGYGHGRAMTVLKHSLGLKARQCIPMAIFPIFLLAFIGLFIHALLSVPFISWVALCITAGMVISYKDENSLWSQGILIGFSAMIMHFAWSYGFCQRVMKHVVKRLSFEKSKA